MICPDDRLSRIEGELDKPFITGMAGQDYRYFMVFNEDAIPDAYTLDDVVDVLRDL